MYTIYETIDIIMDSDCNDLTITSSNLGQIGDIAAGGSYQLEANITI